MGNFGKSMSDVSHFVLGSVGGGLIPKRVAHGPVSGHRHRRGRGEANETG
ncbi:MAG: hypothetical protein ACRD99_01685 [Nitrososphaera sp.]